MRIRASGPIASRTASRRCASEARSEPGSATFTFAVRAPPTVAIRAASTGGSTGIVALTSTSSRRGAGRGVVASSSAARSQAVDSAAS